MDADNQRITKTDQAPKKNDAVEPAQSLKPVPSARFGSFWAGAVIFGAVTTLVAVCMMLDMNWTLGDDHLFLDTLGRGLPMPWAVLNQPSVGRFAPLQYQEYSIFRLALPQAYDAALPGRLMAVNVFFVVALSGIWFAVLNRVYRMADPGYRAVGGGLLAAIFLVVYFLHPSTAFNCMVLVISAERMIPFFMAVFLWAWLGGMRTDKIGYYALAVAAAAGMTYWKEVGFIFPTAVAGVTLCFFRSAISRRHLGFIAALGLNAVVFVTLYYFLSYRHIEQSYASGRTGLGYGKLFTSIFFQDIFILASALALWRMYRLIFRKDRAHLFADACLLAGLAYLLGYVALKLPDARYHTPAVFTSMTALLYWLTRAARMGRWLPIAAAAVFALAAIGVYGPRSTNTVTGTIAARRTHMLDVNQLAARIRAGETAYYYHFPIHSPATAAMDTYFRTVWRFFLNYAMRRPAGDGRTLIPLTPDSPGLSPDSFVLFGTDRFQHAEEFNRAMAKFHLRESSHLSSWGTMLAAPLPRVALPLTIELARDRHFRGAGFEEFQEGFPRWTIAGQATIGLELSPEEQGPLDLNAAFSTFLTDAVPRRSVEIWANDTLVGQWDLLLANGDQALRDYRCSIPAGLLRPDGTLDIRFNVHPTPSPESLGIGIDSRTLGIYLHALTLEKADDAAP